MTTNEQETRENEQANIAIVRGYLIEYRRAMLQAARARHIPLRAEFLTIAGFRLYDIEKHLSSVPLSRSQEQETPQAEESDVSKHLSYTTALTGLQNALNEYEQNRKIAHIHGNNTNKSEFFKQETDNLTTFQKELLALIAAHKADTISLE